MIYLFESVLFLK